MGLARNVTIGGGSYKKRVRVTGAGYAWVGETDAPVESATPTFALLEYPVGKIYAEPQISQDLLEDAEIDVEAELQSELELDLAEGVGTSLITGVGVNKPRGLLSYPTIANASYAWGKVGYIASGAAGAFAASNPSDQLIDLVHALRPGLRNGAAWLLNDLTLAAIRKFKDSTGQYLWQPSLQANTPSLLLGYPVATDENMPDVSANSLSIAFGNFQRAYVVVNRRGIAVLRDPYTAKPFVKFYTTKRIGGGIQNYEAVKLMKMAAS
jgi:HK97 family phage major capsid protein